jgi:hypothetical protein
MQTSVPSGVQKKQLQVCMCDCVGPQWACELPRPDCLGSAPAAASAGTRPRQYGFALAQGARQLALDVYKVFVKWT